MMTRKQKITTSVPERISYLYISPCAPPSFFLFVCFQRWVELQKRFSFVETAHENPLILEGIAYGSSVL